jgi:hypothetical protein
MFESAVFLDAGISRAKSENSVCAEGGREMAGQTEIVACVSGHN